jgi:hypothetical protein
VAPQGPLYERYEQMLEAGAKPNLAKQSAARAIAATLPCVWMHDAECQPKRIRRSMTTDRGVSAAAWPGRHPIASSPPGAEARTVRS